MQQGAKRGPELVLPADGSKVGLRARQAPGRSDAVEPPPPEIASPSQSVPPPREASIPLRAEPPTASPVPAQSGEAYSVYLSGRTREPAQALTQTIQLQQKFAPVLAPRRLTYKAVKTSGGLEYRPRLGRLTQDEAHSICERLKAGGGECEVGPD